MIGLAGNGFKSVLELCFPRTRQEIVRASGAGRDLRVAGWTRHMSVLENQLNVTGAFVAGEIFSLADIPIGLSVNRCFSTPFEHPRFAAISNYFDRLADRTGFAAYCKNGTPCS